eukprot:gene39246-47763_t
MSDNSSSNSSPNQGPMEDIGALKQEARDSRLSLRKTQEEVLRRKLHAEAFQHCKEEVVAFGECVKQEGFWVIFNCRQQNAALNDCFKRHTTEEAFDKFLFARGYDKSKLQTKPRSSLF